MTDTKKLKRAAIIFTILSFLCMFGPMLGYCIVAFVSKTIVVYKAALTSTIAVVLAMTAIAVFKKWAVRSRLWVIILGLYFCLDHFLEIVIIFAITQILDELVFTPIKHYLWEKYRDSKEKDK